MKRLALILFASILFHGAPLFAQVMAPSLSLCPGILNDGIVCTVDHCDPVTKVITHTPDPLLCNDGDSCTKDVCESTGCKFHPFSLSDGDACTKDICDRKAGVKHEPIVIDDQNKCTVDSCDPKKGLLHAKIDPKIDTECSVGKGACLAKGPWVCDAKSGVITCSAKEGQPSTETCDQIDNDCDGLVDDVADVGKPCSDGEGRCNVSGVLECKPNGSLACSVAAGDGSGEKCDNVDNDCDGSVDESLSQGCFDGPSYAEGVGVCKEGRQDCRGGKWDACVGSVSPAYDDICDNFLDDDCDGEVDDGCVAELKAEPVAEPVDRDRPFARTEPTGALTARREPEPEGERPRIPSVTARPEEPPLVGPPFIVTPPFGTVVKPPPSKGEPAPPKVIAPKKEKQETPPKPTVVEKKPEAKKEPVPPKKPEAKKEPVPAKEPTAKAKPALAGACQSEIFECPVISWSPYKNVDACAVFYSNSFEKQFLACAGHTGETAGLSYFFSREMEPKNDFPIHTRSLPESLKFIAFADLDGNGIGDIVAVTKSNHYQYLLDLETVQDLSPVPLGDLDRPESTLVHAIKIVGGDKIFGAVSWVTGGDEPKKVLGLDVFHRGEGGEFDHFFQPIKEYDVAAKISPVRIEVLGPDIAVIAGEEWFHCPSGDGESFSCEANPEMEGFFPVVVFKERGENRPSRHVLVSRAGEVRELHGRRLRSVEPFSWKTQAFAHGQIEATGHHIVFTSDSALRVLRTGEDLQIEMLAKENLTVNEDKETIYRCSKFPLPLLFNEHGGTDIFTVCDAVDKPTNKKLGEVFAVFINRNEQPHLELESVSGGGIKVKGWDDMGDRLIYKVIFKDEEGNDFSYCITLIDRESFLQIDPECLGGAEAVSASVSKSSVSGGGNAKTFLGEMTTTDPGGLSASKGFTVGLSESGELITSILGPGIVGSEFIAEDTGGEESEKETYGVTGGGCSGWFLQIAPDKSAHPFSYILPPFVLLFFGLLLRRTFR